MVDRDGPRDERAIARRVLVRAQREPRVANIRADELVALDDGTHKRRPREFGVDARLADDLALELGDRAPERGRRLPLAAHVLAEPGFGGEGRDKPLLDKPRDKIARLSVAVEHEKHAISRPPTCGSRRARARAEAAACVRSVASRARRHSLRRRTHITSASWFFLRGLYGAYPFFETPLYSRITVPLLPSLLPFSSIEIPSTPSMSVLSLITDSLRRAPPSPAASCATEARLD